MRNVRIRKAKGNRMSIKASFTCEQWTWLNVHERGDWKSRDTEEWVTGRLMKWMQSERIDWRAVRSGGGAWVGRIPVADTERVREWLASNGAVQEEEG